MSSSLMIWLFPMIAVVLPLVASGFVAPSQLSKEQEKNKRFNTPDEHQVYWHVEHNREDIKAIYLVVMVSTIMQVAMLAAILEAVTK